MQNNEAPEIIMAFTIMSHNSWWVRYYIIKWFIIPLQFCLLFMHIFILNCFGCHNNKDLKFIFSGVLRVSENTQKIFIWVMLQWKWTTEICFLKLKKEIRTFLLRNNPSFWSNGDFTWWRIASFCFLSLESPLYTHYLILLVCSIACLCCLQSRKIARTL